MVDQIGIGTVRRQAADILANAPRCVVTKTAFDDLVGAGLGQVLGGADIAVAIHHATVRERHRVQHAIAIKPVAKLLTANLVTARPNSEEGAAHRLGDCAFHLIQGNGVVQFLFQRFEPAMMSDHWLAMLVFHQPCLAVHVGLHVCRAACIRQV